MRITPLEDIKNERSTVGAFYGYDHRLLGDTGCFYDMENMSGESCPVICTRRPRGIFDFDGETIRGMCCHDTWFGGQLRENAFIIFTDSHTHICYYDENGAPQKGAFLPGGVTPLQGEKKLIESGGYLYIFPDKYYINLLDPTDRGLLEHTAQKQTGAAPGGGWVEAVIQPCDSGGTDVSYATTKPASPTDGAYWLDGDALYVWSEVQEMWCAVAASYFKLSFKAYAYTGGQKGTYLSDIGFTTGFSQNDAVELSGFTLPSLNSSFVIHEIPSQTVMVFEGLSGAHTEASGAVSISRVLPDMDFVVASGNRLWGCYYGFGDDGKVINEIYASSPGLAKNWRRYQGISDDSWSASCGGEGVWTGATVYGGYPTFFKEDSVYRIAGSVPSEFTIHTDAYRGIRKGASKSAVIINEVLYYQSHSGVVAYNGSYPQNIDAPLGTVTYKNAVAGSVGALYYISMQDADGAWHLFNYDTERHIWHREDSLHALSMIRCDNELYMLSSDNETVYSVHGSVWGSGAAAETDIPFYATTGQTGYMTQDYKYISQIQVRISLEAGRWCEISAEYDSSGHFEPLGRLRREGTGLFTVPVVLRRCDHFRLRISGTGSIKIYSISTLTQQGSEWNA